MILDLSQLLHPYLCGVGAVLAAATAGVFLAPLLFSSRQARHIATGLSLTIALSLFWPWFLAVIVVLVPLLAFLAISVLLEFLFQTWSGVVRSQGLHGRVRALSFRIRTARWR